jgi:hypothetical protein
MFKEIDRVIEAAMELPPEDRLRVAERLRESVPDDQSTRAWLDEAERRKAAWDSGLETGIDGDEVIRGLRDRARQ